jgi:hypothetical protein
MDKIIFFFFIFSREDSFEDKTMKYIYLAALYRVEREFKFLEDRNVKHKNGPRSAFARDNRDKRKMDRSEQRFCGVSKKKYLR